MSVYLIAQLHFVEESRYREYQRAFPAVFSAYSGRLLVSDESPVSIEGDWHCDKVVVMEFESAEAANDLLQSSEYQKISEDRRAGAHTKAMLVEGFSVQSLT